MSSNLKSDGVWFFEKNLFLVFLGCEDPKIAQNKVFQVLWNIGTQNLSDLFHKVAVAYELKIYLNGFFWGESLVLRFFGQKRFFSYKISVWNISNLLLDDTAA